MPRSKYQLYIHLVWATKKREPFISLELESAIQNIFREKCQQFSFEILTFRNTEDHIHLLLSINPNVKITDFVAGAKGASSHYINHELGNYYTGRMVTDVSKADFAGNSVGAFQVANFALHQWEAKKR